MNIARNFVSSAVPAGQNAYVIKAEDWDFVSSFLAEVIDLNAVQTDGENYYVLGDNMDLLRAYLDDVNEFDGNESLVELGHYYVSGQAGGHD